MGSLLAFASSSLRPELAPEVDGALPREVPGKPLLLPPRLETPLLYESYERGHRVENGQCFKMPGVSVLS